MNKVTAQEELEFSVVCFRQCQLPHVVCRKANNSAQKWVARQSEQANVCQNASSPQESVGNLIHNNFAGLCPQAATRRRGEARRGGMAKWGGEAG